MHFTALGWSTEEEFADGGVLVVCTAGDPEGVA